MSEKSGYFGQQSRPNGDDLSLNFVTLLHQIKMIELTFPQLMYSTADSRKKKKTCRSSSSELTKSGSRIKNELPITSGLIRFGKISPLWQLFISIGQTFERSLENSVCRR